MRALFLFSILLYLLQSGHSQTPSPAQQATIDQMLEAYNQQNFKMMKKPWGFLGKLLVTPKRLQAEFGPFYEKNGKASIDTIFCRSIYDCSARLRLEKNPRQRSYLSFIFNDKAKLQGFGLGYPFFIYRKQTGSMSAKDPSRKAHLDSLFHVYAPSPEKGLSGCLRVQRGDDVIYQNCSGYSNKKEQLPLNDSSVFLLASCSKQFTAAAILLLMERGLLSEETYVQKILPDFPYEQVQVKHLLTHTSGLPDYHSLLEKHWDASKFASNWDILQLLKEHQPSLYFEPNVSFQYSNTGYVILSLIIETLSQLSYGAFLEKEFFTPLGLGNTYCHARRKEKHLPNNYALGYVYSKQGYQVPDSLENYAYVVYMDGITGDDGVSSTTEDMVKWNKALHSGQVLNQISMEKMFQRHLLADGRLTDYGYGLFVQSGPGVESLNYHTGYWPGYTTMNMYFPEQDLSIVILSNNSYRSTLQLADKIAARMLEP
jgi:CubicO group peptidase (beta-lactamase class C family)